MGQMWPMVPWPCSAVLLRKKSGRPQRLGYDSIELMVRDPAGLDWSAVRAHGSGLDWLFRRG